MKKVLFLLLLIPVFAFGQQTYYSNGVPPHTVSTGITVRKDTSASVDSLRPIWLGLDGKKFYKFDLSPQTISYFDPNIFKGNGTSLSDPVTLMLDSPASTMNNFPIFMNSNGQLFRPNINFSTLNNTVIYNGIKINANGGLQTNLSTQTARAYFIKQDSATGDAYKDTATYLPLILSNATHTVNNSHKWTIDSAQFLNAPVNGKNPLRLADSDKYVKITAGIIQGPQNLTLNSGSIATLTITNSNSSNAPALTVFGQTEFHGQAVFYNTVQSPTYIVPLLAGTPNSYNIGQGVDSTLEANRSGKAGILFQDTILWTSTAGGARASRFLTTADLPGGGYVPTSRTLTINGTTQDLTANRSWTITTANTDTTGTGFATNALLSTYLSKASIVSTYATISNLALKVAYTDTATMLANYIPKNVTSTIPSAKTFSKTVYLTQNATALTPIFGANETPLQALGANSSDIVDEWRAFNGHVVRYHLRANGTAASPTTLQANDEISAPVDVGGFDGTNWTSEGAFVMQGFAGSTWTTSNHEAYGVMKVTPSGSTTLTSSMKWASDLSVQFAGAVGIGNFFSPNIAADPSYDGILGVIGTTNSANRGVIYVGADANNTTTTVGEYDFLSAANTSGYKIARLYSQISGGSGTNKGGNMVLQSKVPAGSLTTFLQGNNDQTIVIPHYTTVNGLLYTDGSGNISQSTALPNGTTATTQAALSNDTKLATDAYTDNAILAEQGSSDFKALNAIGGNNGTAWKGYVPGNAFPTTGNILTLVNQRLYFYPVYVPVATTITGVSFMLTTAGSYTSTGYNGIGLYTMSGGTLTRVDSTATSTTFWAGSTGMNNVNFVTTYAAAAGVYWIGMLYQRSAETTAPVIFATSESTTSAMGWGLPNSIKIIGQINSKTDIPTSQAMSGVSNSLLLPFTYLY